MRIIGTIASLLIALSLAAAEGRDEPTVLAAGTGTPAARAAVDDLAWIAGHWRGRGLGAVAEEIWSAPEAGSMMGVFRLMRESSVAFYEIMTITRDGDGVLLRIKHFNADLTGWEEKDQSVEFRLLKLEPNRAWFDGLTFVRNGDELRVWVRISDRAEGSSRVEEFVYRRH